MLCLRIGPRNRISAVKARIWKIWPIILSTIDALIFTFDAWCVYIWIFERCCVLRHRRQTKDILVLLIQLAWQPVYPLDDNSQIYDGHLFIPTCIVLHLGLAVECVHTTLDASAFFIMLVAIITDHGEEQVGNLQFLLVTLCYTGVLLITNPQLF